jgi:hydrogenase maturation factor
MTDIKTNLDILIFQTITGLKIDDILPDNRAEMLAGAKKEFNDKLIEIMQENNQRKEAYIISELIENPEKEKKLSTDQIKELECLILANSEETINQLMEQ